MASGPLGSVANAIRSVARVMGGGELSSEQSALKKNAVAVVVKSKRGDAMRVQADVTS